MRGARLRASCASSATTADRVGPSAGEEKWCGQSLDETVLQSEGCMRRPARNGAYNLSSASASKI
jgi:hypothetical protein